MATVTNPPEKFLDDKGNLVFDYGGIKISMRKASGTHFWILHDSPLEIWMHFYESENSYVCRVFENVNSPYIYAHPDPSCAFDVAVNNYREWEIQLKEMRLNRLISGL